MIRSMTAFARQDSSVGPHKLSCELRSVNHRHLELHLRLPDALRALEPKLRAQLRQHLQRGKVELWVHETQERPSDLVLDRELATRIIQLAAEVDAMARHTAPLQALDVLRFPGVLNSSTSTVAKESVLALVAATLPSFIAAREREGEALRRVLEERLQALADHLAGLATALPQLLAQQSERLRRLLLAAVPEASGERLHEELVLLAQRSDVAEEMARLRTHGDEFRRILAQGGAVGRQLDFLLQEMNREANTLAAKSVAAEQTLVAVEIKLIIEQLREQVQNLE